MKRQEYKKAMEKVIEYEGIMTDEQLHEEFGIAPSLAKRLRAILERQRKKPKHQCWSCKKATNMFKCKYVMSCVGTGDNRKYYDDTEVINGIIVNCPEYVKG